LREALAAEIEAAGDLSQVTVTAVADRAGITRRTFYSHYRDIPNLVACVEEEALADLRTLVCDVAQVTLPELEEAISRFEPCPRSVEVLAYFQQEGTHLVPLLGEGGDPAFAEKLKDMVRRVVLDRALHGFTAAALPVFEYYLTFVISAEVGVLMRWLATGMVEPPDIMARMMTALLFVRPGDLYGRPINFDIVGLATKASLLGEETHHVA
jgi:AcrR family transcriptional regulator